jgi:hypothetical protein
MSTETGPRPDIFSPAFGMTMIGAGLVALAAVEGARLMADTARRSADVAMHESVATPEPEASSPVPETETWSECAVLPQDSIAVGGGQATSPRGPRSALLGITAAPMPNGLAIFRMYANGAVEAMITTEDNRWGAWVPVAPGLSTDMRRPAASDGNPDTENTP